MNKTGADSKTNFQTLLIFAIAMGFLEAIVVVYVRELYYPEGFEFPIKILPPWLVGIELIRELSTLLMLGSLAWISGKTFLQRLSVFLFSFGVWDIIYYVALKIFLDWPESFFTWDILFLIPITWLAPVLAPIICSALMIGMAFIFEYFRLNKNIKYLNWKELLLMFLGAAIIYISFTYDIGLIIIKGNYLHSFGGLAKNKEFLNELSTFLPKQFQWYIFVIGILFILTSNFVLIKRSISSK